jgi:hypothetical protein
MHLESIHFIFCIAHGIVDKKTLNFYTRLASNIVMFNSSTIGDGI